MSLVDRKRTSTLEVNVDGPAQRAAERRSTADRREPAPTGNGKLVLDYVATKIGLQIDQASRASRQGIPIINAAHLVLLLEDLKQRSETGAKKYGTPLRTDNGRKAYFDLFQEVCDGIMYAAQARMEGDTEAGQYVEILIQIGSQLAGIVNKRG